MTVTPTRGFPGGQVGEVYTVWATNDAVLDAAGAGGFEGIAQHSFRAADVTGPALLLSFPAAGGTAIGLDVEVVLLFNEPAFPVAGKSLTLVALAPSTVVPAERAIPVEALRGVGTARLSVSLASEPLVSSGKYELRIAGDVLEDAAENRFAATSVAFATIDVTAPELVAVHPDAGLAVSYFRDEPLTLTFDEPVFPGQGDILLSDVTGGDVTFLRVDGPHVSFSGAAMTLQAAEFILPNDEPDAIYTVTVPRGAVIDGAVVGNPFAGQTRALEIAVVNTIQTPRVAVDNAGAGLSTVATFSFATLLAIAPYDALVVTVPAATADGYTYGEGSGFRFPPAAAVGAFTVTAADHGLVLAGGGGGDGDGGEAGAQQQQPPGAGFAAEFATLTSFNQTARTITVQNVAATTLPAGSMVTVDVAGITLPAVAGRSAEYTFELHLPSLLLPATADNPDNSSSSSRRRSQQPGGRARAPGTDVSNTHVPEFAEPAFRVLLEETFIFDDPRPPPLLPAAGGGAGAAAVPASTGAEIPPFVSAVVTTVVATDRDKGSTQPITYRIVDATPSVNDIFAVDALTGQIKTLQYIDYDGSDSPHEYVVTIEATDGMPPYWTANSTITIEITDANDHAPAFAIPAPNLYYEAVVHETETAVGTVVMTAVALDADGGSNGNVTFTLESPSDDFAVDLLTGRVTLTRQQSRAARPHAVLSIVASDQATPAATRRSSTVLVSTDTLSDQVLVFSSVTTAVKGSFVPADYERYLTDALCVGNVACRLSTTLYTHAARADAAETIDVAAFVRLRPGSLETPSRILFMDPGDIVSALSRPEVNEAVLAIDRGFTSATFSAATGGEGVVVAAGGGGAGTPATAAAISTSVIIAIVGASLLVVIGCVILIFCFRTRSKKSRQSKLQMLAFQGFHQPAPRRASGRGSAVQYAGGWGSQVHMHPGTPLSSPPPPRPTMMMMSPTPSYDNQQAYMDPVSTPYAMHATYGIGSPATMAQRGVQFVSPLPADASYLSVFDQTPGAPMSPIEQDMHVLFEGDQAYYGQQFKNPVYAAPAVTGRSSATHQHNAAAAWKAAQQQNRSSANRQQPPPQQQQRQQMGDEYLQFEEDAMPFSDDTRTLGGASMMPEDNEWAAATNMLESYGGGGGGAGAGMDGQDLRAAPQVHTMAYSQGGSAGDAEWEDHEAALRTIFEDDTREPNQFVTLGNN